MIPLTELYSSDRIILIFGMVRIRVAVWYRSLDTRLTHGPIGVVTTVVDRGLVTVV